MQNLHRDLAACVMHSVGDNLMVGNIVVREQARCTGKDAAFAIGRHAPRDHQPDTAARACRIKGRNAGPVLRFLKTGVHRPHQHAVLQCRKTKVKRRKQTRIISHGWAPNS